MKTPFLKMDKRSLMATKKINSAAIANITTPSVMVLKFIGFFEKYFVGDEFRLNTPNTSIIDGFYQKMVCQ